MCEQRADRGWHARLPHHTERDNCVIVGVLFCGALVLTTTAVGSFSQDLERSARALAVDTHFQDFAKGIVSLTALVYFGGVAAFSST